MKPEKTDKRISIRLPFILWRRLAQAKLDGHFESIQDFACDSMARQLALVLKRHESANRR